MMNARSPFHLLQHSGNILCVLQNLNAQGEGCDPPDGNTLMNGQNVCPGLSHALENIRQYTRLVIHLEGESHSGTLGILMKFKNIVLVRLLN